MNEQELMHFGIHGMKWGIRRFQNDDGTLTPAGKKRYREASKDAKEFARAKMYYGEGAGNRRKFIKAKVDEKSKDPGYKEAFDYALNKQDMNKHVKAAKAERIIRDTAAAAAVAAVAAMRITGLDRKLIEKGKDSAEWLMEEIRRMR